MAHLTEEVTRLRSFEFESFRKEQLIQQLQQQITNLQVRNSFLISVELFVVLHLETAVIDMLIIMPYFRVAVLYPYHWALGPLSWKDRHGIFNVCSSLGA